MKRHYIIPIFVPHKGCPHDCVFCNQKHITGQTDDIDDVFVKNEIETYLKTIPEGDRLVEVSFFGGSFTGLPIEEQIRLLKPAQRALNERKIDAIRLSTRPDYIDDNILMVLKEYGVSIIELGVQSMDDQVLMMSNRGHTKEDVYISSEVIKSWGFTLGLQMMIGLPGDSEEKDLMTAMEFIKIKPDFVRIYPALIIKDTYMEYMYKKGLYKPLSVDEAVDICSKVYLEFERAGIKIIRIGLQPTDNISPGRDLVAGPFQPAIRELVESKILNDIVVYLYSKEPCENSCIAVNPRSISKLYADGKKYFYRTLKRLGLAGFHVVQDSSVEPNTIMLKNEKNSLIMSIKDYSLIK